MQELITWIVIVAAFTILIVKIFKMLKLFRKPDPCRGCGNSCEKCPVYMKGEK